MQRFALAERKEGNRKAGQSGRCTKPFLQEGATLVFAEFSAWQIASRISCFRLLEMAGFSLPLLQAGRKGKPAKEGSDGSFES